MLNKKPSSISTMRLLTPVAVSLAFLDSHRMRRVHQPPFSPDLAPSDFYLFGKVKTTLMGSVFENEQELLDELSSISI
jgi:hypothetical protein